jgi:hypothetical protein
MWGLLRIILLVGNAGYFASWVYIAITQSHAPSLDWWDLFFYGLMTCLALNVVYLWLFMDWRVFRSSNWRVFRLIGLWFDAKESELRKRIDRSRQDK